MKTRESIGHLLLVLIVGWEVVLRRYQARGRSRALPTISVAPSIPGSRKPTFIRQFAIVGGFGPFVRRLSSRSLSNIG